jgi:hypothetical protein
MGLVIDAKVISFCEDFLFSASRKKFQEVLIDRSHADSGRNRSV